MSYDGSGVFNINTAGQPVITGTTISSTTFNSLTADLATGLTTALTKDGQSTPTANIGMGAFKITNLAAGTVASDAARLDQVQGGAATFITVTGTDTLTGTTSPALAAYATGNQFSFVVANTNTGAVTINVDGIGSKAITRTGTTALVAGDMVAGQAVEIIYDGTRFQLVNGNSFTNLKVSGTLGVTGVATFTAQPIVSSLTASLPVFTDASKGLVSNTMTGTGDVVMSTSPTLVTPALGTPSALVGTNITGTATNFTASNVTTNANLTGEATSVGNATTLTNSAVIGKVITGYVSGAGTVAATDTILQAIQKLNGNDATNANLTGPITSVGNTTSIASQTGTGTTFAMSASPTFTGTVGAADVTTTGNTILGNASTDTLNVGNGDLVKDASGNVGIGTASPSVRLHIKASASTFVNFAQENTNGGTDAKIVDWLNNGNTYSLRLLNDAYNAANSAYSVERSGYTVLNQVWYTGSSTERMRIDSSGNVGIGTASPTAKLDVATSINLSGQNYLNAAYDLGGGAGWLCGYNITYSSSAVRNVTTGALSGVVYGSSGLQFYTNTSAAGGTAASERMRIDSSGNAYVEAGNLWQYSPAPTALAAGANAGTAAQLRSGMFSAAQTTAVTLTMPTGTAIDTGFSGVPAVDIGFYFYVINTGSALGAVTVAVNTNVTSLGSLVVAIGTSAQFRLRRTAANTYIMYRLS